MFYFTRPGFAEVVFGEEALTPEIDTKPCNHADSCSHEAVLPGVLLSEGSADEWREERPEIDSHVEDREGPVTARIARRVEASDLRGDVRLKAAVAQNKEEEARQECCFAHQQELAARHQETADDHGFPLADHLVGQKSAEKRGEIYEARIETVDLRREGLNSHGTENRFKPRLQDSEAENIPAVKSVLDKVVGHVQDEQGAHAVVGETLPHLGEKQHEQPARMSQNCLLAGDAGTRSYCIGFCSLHLIPLVFNRLSRATANKIIGLLTEVKLQDHAKHYP